MAHINFKIVPILRSDRRYPLSIYARVVNALEDELLNGRCKSIALDGMGAVVRNWRSRPSFRASLRKGGLGGGAVRGDEIEVLYGLPSLVTEADRHYAYVTRGVRPRDIYPSRRGYLWVRGGRGGYKPKTRPGGYYGGPGTYDMLGSYYSRHVRWPGIEARDFESHVARQVGPWIIRALRGVVARTVAGLGGG